MSSSPEIHPHGGELVHLITSAEVAESLQAASADFFSVTLSKRQLCDLELLLTGGFSPLCGFMGKVDYDSVVEQQTLANGILWTIPVTLDIAEKTAEKLQAGQTLALRDQEGFMVAAMTVEEVWAPDKSREAELVYSTGSTGHPGVDHLLNHTAKYYVAGKVQGTRAPQHFDFEESWYSPAELRAFFRKAGWRRVLAFQTSKPMHRLHKEIVLQTAKDLQAHVLVHPVAGIAKPGDLEYFSRIRCYQAIMQYFPKRLTHLSLLPLALRLAGPREVLWHAIVQQNYGCSHFIVGPGHASPSRKGSDQGFYSSESFHESLSGKQEQLQIKVISCAEHAWSESRGRYLPLSDFKENQEQPLSMDDKIIRKTLSRGDSLPAWCSYPEVVAELQKIYPPRSKQGFTLFFTGLSGSGKSTLAKILYAKLIEDNRRPVTLLDGDIVRLNLSSELGFSKQDRDINISRIGFVANEISKNGGVAICAPIAPYRKVRRKVRKLIEDHGAFIEIHVSTPLEVCEARDRKGLYAKARSGLIPEFTGVSDPYDEPENPEIRIDTSESTSMEAAQEIFLYLLREGFLDQEVY